VVGRRLGCVERPRVPDASRTAKAVSDCRRRPGIQSPNAITVELLFLVLNRTKKQWTMPTREWVMAKAQFTVLFGERFTKAFA
jgi:putative transposase